MIVLNSPKVHRPRKRAARATRPVQALSLVAAVYQPEQYVRLTFDRAVDADAFVTADVVITDNVIGAKYMGTEAPDVISPVTIQVNLVIFDMSAGSGVSLTASADTGLVAVDDGGTWAGATDLELPFP